MEQKFEGKFEKEIITPEQGKDFLEAPKQEEEPRVVNDIDKEKIVEPVLNPQPQASRPHNTEIDPVLQNKLKYYLDLCEEKGISEVVKMIEDMKDPFLLDSFHDAVARENLFEKLLNKKKK
jgi:hypothetical protein